MDKIAALMMHHVQRIPLTRFKAGFSSSLRQKKAIFDLMALFRQLEIQGIQPEQYEQYLVSSQEEIVAELKELPETYRMYRELLEANQVTSWHGIVLDTLSLMQSDPYFTQNLLEGYTDVVVDELQVMTPAMIKVF
jgi:superfamily I DNA/RNA helicase